MVRAQTTGMIDFSQFDPWDTWWWRRTQWVLDELATQQSAKVAEIQHKHWITIVSNNRLTDDSFDKAKINASEAFNKVLKATYPWLSDSLNEEGSKTANTALVEAYREEFGNPGDPQYEAMIASLREVFEKGPMTQWEKDRARKARKELSNVDISSKHVSG